MLQRLSHLHDHEHSGPDHRWCRRPCRNPAPSRNAKRSDVEPRGPESAATDPQPLRPRVRPPPRVLVPTIRVGARSALVPPEVASHAGYAGVEARPRAPRSPLAPDATTNDLSIGIPFARSSAQPWLNGYRRSLRANSPPPPSAPRQKLNTARNGVPFSSCAHVWIVALNFEPSVRSDRRD